MPLTEDTALELEVNLHQQAPQSATKADLQLYFKIHNCIDMCMMTRAKKQAAIKEDIKHFLEEIWALTPEETPYKIFFRKARLGIDDVPVLSKEEMHDLSHKTEDGDAVYLTSVDAGRIRMLLHFKRNLLEQDSYPDDR